MLFYSWQEILWHEEIPYSFYPFGHEGIHVLNFLSLDGISPFLTRDSIDNFMGKYEK
jgi:hypothetical protein